MNTKNQNEMSTIEINLTDEEFCRVAKLAHERDITFNQMVAIIIQEEIDRRECTPST